MLTLPVSRSILTTASPPFQAAGSGGRRVHIRRAAPGYLRTYYHLIKNESDLRIVQGPSLCLVSPDISWEQFCNFTSSLADIANHDVSLRYAYGEICLMQLNLYTPLLLGRLPFQRVEYQDYISSSK
ncbi:hypothetical protein BKA56DRAFT_681004 [Ilyonectria sp. MPI-CAGE-AT-0026]|nr:hypothetical protein BKA56DRAFT_681004 [Ilyonectria sp. MPI-CAGE-AT-0026]